MTEKIKEELQAQANLLESEHKQAMIAATSHLTGEITELRAALEEKAAQLKESEASLVRLTHSDRKNSELYEKLKKDVAHQINVAASRHHDELESICALLVQRAGSSSS
jgi:hypothetical protein